MSFDRTTPSKWAALVIIPLAVAVLPAAAAPFTIVVLPDTQYYTRSHVDHDDLSHIFNAQTQWIVDQRAAMNIAFVSHVGDIVENGPGADVDEEWRRGHEAMAVLDTVAPTLPYAVVPGNHDYDETNNTATAANYVTHFGSARYAGRGWYGGASPDEFNHYQLFSANGRSFLHLALEWRPRATSIAWAQSILDIHPDTPTIISTHEYTEVGGARRPAGQSIFNALVTDNNQVFMLLSGHRPGEGHQVATNTAGSQVYEMLADYQSRTNGGDGWLRMISFDEDAGLIRVTTYSPTLDQFETDANSQFSFAVDFNARFGEASVVPSPTAAGSGLILLMASAAWRRAGHRSRAAASP